MKTDQTEWMQADLSLRWAHMPFCWFCHDAAHFTATYSKSFYYLFFEIGILPIISDIYYIRYLVD